MSRKLSLLTLSLITPFLYSQFAEAGLVRSSGRGDLSSNYSEGYYYVPNAYVNSLGITAEGMASFTNAGIKTRTVGGGGRGLGSVPSECIRGYTQDEVEDIEAYRRSELDDISNNIDQSLPDAEYYAAYTAAENAINDKYDAQVRAKTEGTPCVWEFDYGEDLFTFGFFSLDFGTPDVNYSVNWQIVGGGNTWNLGGFVDNGSVILNTAAPVDLFAGDYQIKVNVSFYSSAGTFFYDRNRPGDEVSLREVCDVNPDYDSYYAANGPYEMWDNAFIAWEDNGMIGPAPVQPPEPEFEICGTTGIGERDERVDPSQFFTSDFELLRILPVSSGPNDPVDSVVSAPASIGMLVSGLAGMGLRRKQRSSRKV
ncbi:MAG: hypothetical protein GW763_00425 [Paraglaciecola sp.]|nr:hypothetical protein [Paraglaciecola sp.]NCT46458.1 hypothetical protein [Paraglaciecola sp.]